jgi:hypothetical protein
MATLPVMGYVVGGAFQPLVAASTLWGKRRFCWGGFSVGCCALTPPGAKTSGCCARHRGGRLLQRQQPVPPRPRSWPRAREKAVSLVMAGGLWAVAAQSGRGTRDLSAWVRGATALAGGAAGNGLMAPSLCRRPRDCIARQWRPLGNLRQPVSVAVLRRARIWFMNLWMAATPIAMQQQPGFLDALCIAVACDRDVRPVFHRQPIKRLGPASWHRRG